MVLLNNMNLFYHGTSDFGFDNFNKNEVNYFTNNYDYVKKYINPAYSALRSGKNDGVKGIYTVKLKCKNIFEIPIFSNAAASFGKIVPPPPPTMTMCLYPASFNNFLT